MDIFLLIIQKLIPLYIFIALGFVAGKFFKIEAKQIGTLVIYIIMPLVFVAGLWNSSIQITDFSVFLMVWSLSFLVLLISYFLCGLIYKGKTQNLMAAGLATGNSGYFGIPVALAILDPQIFSIYLLAAISNTMFQITIGYYVLALGKFDWKESLKKLLKLPPLYGAIIGISLSSSGAPIPDLVSGLSVSLKEAFVVLGMMIIGLTLSSFEKMKFDVKFLSLAMIIRFVIWPTLAFGLVFLDTIAFGGALNAIHPIIILFGLLPLGADFAIYAANLNMYPQRAATTVLLSTIIAAVTIPLAYAFLL